ncbi:hypothetical protein [Leptospira barantonii]|uniref:Lipoprotein n=1 Tax=Leptospira barantonii TaxID=2023184 RepID=A0ABX4NNL8_9LEPT|nr:hypothetical protein [Leptospira barantonii]PJZ58430.1 hypothetical protein CH367_05880 [Leptospira barantonii]
MKLLTLWGISVLTFLSLLSCSNYGLNQDQAKKDDDKKKCQTATAAYLACSASNPTMGACDSLYLGVLAVCSSGGSSGGGGGGGGGGY